MAVLWAAAALACSSGEPAMSTPTTPTAPPVSTPSPPPSTQPPLTATVTITDKNTFEPAEVTIFIGGRVTFVNRNNRAHDITSDPKHLHTDCPPIFDVGFIVPGQTKQTGVLSVARSCGFHDHMQENNPDLQGTIIVQGPG